MKRMILWTALCSLVLAGLAFDLSSWARADADAQDESADTVESAQPAEASTEETPATTDSRSAQNAFFGTGNAGNSNNSLFGLGGAPIAAPDEDMTPEEYIQSEHALTYPLVVDAMTATGGPTVLNPARMLLSEGQLLIAWGKSHDKLFGFSSKTRTWDTVEHSSTKPVVPIINGSVAACSLGKRVVAYSADTGKWGSVTVKADVALGAMKVWKDFVWFSSGGQLYTFRASRGTWASTPLNNAQDTAEKAKLLDDLANKSDDPPNETGQNDAEQSNAPSTFGIVGSFSPPKMPDPKQEGVWGSDVGVMCSPERDALYGFSFVTGQWTKLDIEPQNEIQPTVGTTLAVVELSGDVAAYSGKTGHWDILKLNQPITSGPRLTQNVITVRTKDHMYTFAAQGSYWTSPTDASLDKLPSRATEGSQPANAVRSQSSLAGRAVAGAVARMLGTGTAMLDRTWQNAEDESLSIAKKLQHQSKYLGSEHPELARLRQQLRDSVTKAFRVRTESQRQRMKSMEKKLSKIRKSLEARQDLQERIIERRIEELLDPQVNWNAARESVAAPVGGSPPGMPAVGRSIGLPGPPSISVDGPGPGVVHPSTKLKIRNSETTAPSPASAAVVWDKAELLLQQLEERFKPIDTERTKIDQLVKQIDSLRKPWAESTPEERVAVAQIIRQRRSFGRGLRFGGGGRRTGGTGLRFGSSSGGGAAGRAVRSGNRRADEDDDERPASSGSDDDDETQSDSLADNEVKYELARLSALTHLCDVMERNLQQLDEAIDDYSRPWQRYTDECTSVELNYREAQIEDNAATRLLDREQSLDKLGVGSESNLLKHRVAVEKARIGLQRARHAVDRLKRIENQHPQLKPDQHSKFLDHQRTRLTELRAEIEKWRSEVPDVER